MANFFQNQTGREITVPTPTGGTINVPYLKYVEGDYYAAVPDLTAVTDLAAQSVANADVVFAASSAPSYGNFQIDSVAISNGTSGFHLKTSNVFAVWDPPAAADLYLPPVSASWDGSMVFLTNASAASSGYDITVHAASAAATEATLDSRSGADTVAKATTTMYVLSNGVWYTTAFGAAGASGKSGYSGTSGYSGSGVSGYSGFSGYSGISGYSGKSGYSA